MFGVIILALKDKAYYQGAYNLAFSIKYFNMDIPITLVSDGGHNKMFASQHYSVFNRIVEMNSVDYMLNGMFQPALAKLSINKYTNYEDTLYIDADSLVFRDIEPLFKLIESKGGNFYSQMEGEGYINDVINYQPWVKNNFLWNFFGLKGDDKVRTINSSWFYFNKKTKKLFDAMQKKFLKGFDINDLEKKWGRYIPDELYFNGMLAKMNINPHLSNDVMFFGTQLDKRTLTQISDDYFMFTLYGKGVGRTTVREAYIEYYDRLLFAWHSSRGLNHYFKSSNIMNGKHINDK